MGERVTGHGTVPTHAVVFRSVLVLATLFFAAGIVQGATYEVAPNGNDNASGRRGSPWRTIAKANVTLEAGDTVMVHAGSYSEVIQPANSGAEGRPIVYMAYGDGVVELLGESAQKRGVVGIGWDLESGSQGDPISYVIVDGFTIRYQFAELLRDAPVFTNRFAYVQIGHRRSQHNVIRHCTIYQDGDALQNFIDGYRQVSICVTDAQYTVIEGNDISGTWLGIWLTGETPRFNLVRGNTIHDCGSSMIDIADPEDGSSDLQGNIIENNLLSNSVNEDGIQFEPNYKSDYSQATNRGTIIRNNVVRHCVENAFDLKGASDIVIEGNIVYANTGDDDGSVGGNDRSGGMGGVIHGGAGAAGVASATNDVIVRNNIFFDNYGAIEGGDSYKIYNNTFINNNHDYTGSNSPWRSNPGPGFTAILVYGGANIAIKNNIIAQHAQGELALNVYGVTNADIDYNLYWNSDRVYLCDAGGALFTQFSFPAWQQRLADRGISGAEAHGLVAQPDFLNVPSRPVNDHLAYDFHLASTSPAHDAGGPLTHAVSSGNGTSIQVADAGYFCDGYGVLEAADSIVVESSRPVKITSIDRERNIIQLEVPLSWPAGARIFRPFQGTAPDIGALEAQSQSGLVPAIPAILDPPDGLADAALPVVLSWGRVDANANYHLQICKNDRFVTDLVYERVTGVGDTVVTATGLSAGVKYYWRLRAANGILFSPWTETRSFTTFSQPPPKTVLVGPADGARNQSVNNVLFWRRATLDSVYHLQVARNPGFTGTLVVDDNGVNGNQYALSGLDNQTQYFWRVRALNAAGFGPFSDVWSFVTADPPEVPVLISVGDGVSAPITVLRWRPVRSAISYDVQVGTRPVVEGYVMFERYQISRDTSVTVSGLTAGKAYYWRLRVNAVGGASDWTPSVKFTTAAVEPNDFFLDENYPNPFNVSTQIRFMIPSPVPVTLEVFNILGQKVQMNAYGVLPRGVYEFPLDLGKSPSGIYFYTLTAGIYRQTRKLMYVR